MAVPAVSAFRRAHPDAFVAWAVEDRCAAVVDGERLVDLRRQAHRQAWKRNRWSPRMWSEQLRFYSGLRKERFDLGVDLQGHLKTALCLRVAKPARRAAVQGTDALARRLNPVVVSAEAPRHIVERNLEVLRTLADLAADASPIMPGLAEERSTIREMRNSGVPLVTVTVSAGNPTKVVPKAHWEEIALQIVGQGYQVAFLGGPGDPKPQVPGALNWVGELPLALTMAAVAESAFHLCGDTGTGHIAAAYGVPVVSVFGNMDPVRYRPYTDKAIVLRDGEEASRVPPRRILEAFQNLVERYGPEVPH
jgi:ADP-heptose:LPS heptosyltransferase